MTNYQVSQNTLLKFRFISFSFWSISSNDQLSSLTEHSAQVQVQSCISSTFSWDREGAIECLLLFAFLFGGFSVKYAVMWNMTIVLLNLLVSETLCYVKHGNCYVKHGGLWNTTVVVMWSIQYCETRWSLCETRRVVMWNTLWLLCEGSSLSFCWHMSVTLPRRFVMSTSTPWARSISLTSRDIWHGSLNYRLYYTQSAANGF